MKYPTPRDFAQMNWHAKQRLAAFHKVTVGHLEFKVMHAYKTSMGLRWHHIQKAEQALEDRHEDYGLTRCAMCGAWMFDECTTPHLVYA